MSNMLRRVAPAVFVGTAAVLVVSNASTGAPVAADATATTSPGAATSPDDTATGPQPRGDSFRFFGDDDDDDHGGRYDDDDDDEYSAPQGQSVPVPAPNGGTGTNGGGGSASGSTSGGTGSCTAAEVTGPVVRTEWGPVQVAAKMHNGKVCAVRTLQYPDGDRKSVSINARALPMIEQQVLAAGDASFDGVSGATVTTEGYRDSLQAVLDQAR